VDNLSPKQRSYCMSRVRTKSTNLELLVRSQLRRCGIRFKTNVKTLPGTPDIVLPQAKVAVFIDGDFWHGFRFPLWEDRVSRFWKVKINRNRARDRRNFRALRGMGWRVIRLWQTQLERDLSACVQTIASVRGCRGPINRRNQ
jgi:DNA mismatch endonuclease (patch repair protein)